MIGHRDTPKANESNRRHSRSDLAFAFPEAGIWRYFWQSLAVTVRSVGEEMNRATRQPAEATPPDLKTQLNKAYLSGDGAAVERIMALMAANEQRARVPLEDPLMV